MQSTRSTLRSVLAISIASCAIHAIASAVHLPLPERVRIVSERVPITSSDTLHVERPLPAPPPLVAWSELSARPSVYRGQSIRMRLQFNSTLDTWNPYLTRFGTRQFQALQAWSEEQRLWMKDEFDGPEVRVFFRRNSECAAIAAKAEEYARYEVEGIVREVFLDQPWIEIDRMWLLSEQVTEGTIIHAARAMELVERSAWDVALLEFDQALAGLLPDHFRIELEAERASAHLQSRTAAEERGKRPPIPQVNRKSE